jgi:hypothetical protein
MRVCNDAACAIIFVIVVFFIGKSSATDLPKQGTRYLEVSFFFWDSLGQYVESIDDRANGRLFA